MIIELSDFFNNPSLVAVGPLKIQYYAVTWILSATFIYLYLKSNKIIIELGISNEKINDLVFFYGLFIGAMCGADWVICFSMVRINCLIIHYHYSMCGKVGLAFMVDSWES